MLFRSVDGIFLFTLSPSTPGLFSPIPCVFACVRVRARDGEFFMHERRELQPLQKKKLQITLSSPFIITFSPSSSVNEFSCSSSKLQLAR